MDLTKRLVLGTENDIHNLQIASRFLKEMKIWHEWREYISRTKYSNNWWKINYSILEIFDRVNFTKFLKDRGLLPRNNGLIFVSELFKIFLHVNNVELFSDIEDILQHFKKHTILEKITISFPSFQFLLENGYIDRWRKIKEAKR